MILVTLLQALKRMLTEMEQAAQELYHSSNQDDDDDGDDDGDDDDDDDCDEEENEQSDSSDVVKLHLFTDSSDDRPDSPAGLVDKVANSWRFL